MSQPHRKRKLAVWIGSALAVACGALALLLIFGANRPRTIGANIAAEDITQFYYTLSSSTCPPHRQRYHFYTENGKYFFYHETRAGHAWPLTEENITRFGTVELSPEQLNRVIADPKLRSVFVSRAENFCHVFDMSADAQRLDALFADMHQNCMEDKAFKSELLSAQLMQLMICAYRAHPGQFPQPKGGVSSAVFRAQQYLDEHFADDCSVAELAREMFLSPYYLSHAFKEWTGYSPKQYIMLSRIACAKELLFSTRLTVGEISARCGFGDASNFVRTFRRTTGQTPEQYRKNM